MSSAAAAHMDQKTFREVTGHYPTGVAVVTGRDADGDILALVVGTFSSVSLDPPLVSFLPMKTSRTFERMQECKSLCINVVGGEQEDVVLTIAQRWENKLDGIDWLPFTFGRPRFGGFRRVDRYTDREDRGGRRSLDRAVCGDRLGGDQPGVAADLLSGRVRQLVCTSLMARMITRSCPPSTPHTAPAPMSRHSPPRSAAKYRFSRRSAPMRWRWCCRQRLRGWTAARALLSAFRSFRRSATPTSSTAQPKNRNVGSRNFVAVKTGEGRPPRAAGLRPQAWLPGGLPACRGCVGLCRNARRHSKVRGGSADPLARAHDSGIHLSYAGGLWGPRTLGPPRYDIGSLVLPVRDRNGAFTLTLRLAQLPPQSTGATINRWLDDARPIVAILENGGTQG